MLSANDKCIKNYAVVDLNLGFFFFVVTWRKNKCLVSRHKQNSVRIFSYKISTVFNGVHRY